MIKEIRFKKILETLKKSNNVTFEEFANSLNVSEDTIRRDIDFLSKRGLVVKVRGGAISPKENPFSYQERSKQFPLGKDRIAQKAVHLIESAKTIFVDGGTTLLSFVTKLPIESKIRIISNNMGIIPLLENHKNIELIILGGKFDIITKTTYGQQTIEEINKYKADLYFMSACSIDVKHGITSEYSEDGEVKKQFIKRSKKIVLLANKEKLNQVDFFEVCTFNEIDTLITDYSSDDKALAPFRKFDIEIL